MTPAGSPVFCSPFDEAVGRAGPPAVFARNPDGEWRLAPDLTRDCWSRWDRAPAHPVHVLARDRATGFVTWFLLGHPALLDGHPRLQARPYPDEASARSAWEALGPARVDPRPW